MGNASRRSSWLLFALLLAAGLGGSAHPAAVAGDEAAPSLAVRTDVYRDNPFVAVGAVRLDVRRDAAAQIPAGWRHADAAESGGRADPYRLVKFSGAVGSAQRETLAAAGYEVVAYYPIGSFLVRPSAEGDATELSTLDGVVWVGPFHPYFKIDDRLAEAWSRRDPQLAGVSDGWGLRFTIGVHEPAGRSAVEAAMASLPGFEGLLPTRGPIRVDVDPADFADFVQGVAALPEVAFVESWLPAAVQNDEGVQTGQSGVCENNGNESPNTPIFNQGITGWGSRVAVADTCFDTNEGWFYDDGLDRLPAHETTAPWNLQPADFAQRKFLEYYDMAPSDTTMGCAGNTGCPSGSFCPDHGSHVAGIMVSNCNLDPEGIATATDPANSNGDNDGMAPGAKLVGQDLGNGGLDYLSFGGDLGELVNVAYTNTCDGGDCFIDAHNNSWGSGTDQYTTNARTADEQLWNLKNLLVVAAAGNSGSGYDTIITPAVGKNVLAVGNAENCTVHDIRGSSSRGDTNDHRLKPDVVVTGSDVTSTRNDGDGTTTSNGGCDELTIGGTSMASPAVAGLSAMMMQYFRDGFYPSGTRTPADSLNPSGPLRKAMLINTAQRMTGVGAERNGVTWPNMDQGWGYVVLDNALYFVGDTRKLWLHDEPVGVDVSGTSSMSFQRRVTTGGEPLKVTLNWFDVPHPGSCGGSTPCMLNDLDLTVTDESSGFVYLQTLVAGTTGHVVPRTVVPSSPGVGQTTENNGPDDLNTVEQIIVYNPTPEAIYTFTVSAANTPNGPIPFGLVVTGDHRDPCDAPVAAAAPVVTDLDPCEDGGVQLSWDQDATDWKDGDEGSRSYRVLRDGVPIATGDCAGTFTYPSTSCLDADGPDNFSVAYRIEYTNGCGGDVASPAGVATDGVSHIVNVSPDGVSTICVEQALEFTAEADLQLLGYAYQWTEDGVEMAGETGKVLSVTRDAVESHQYNCRVSHPTTTCIAEDTTPAGGSWTTDPGICPEAVGEVSGQGAGRPLRVQRSGAAVNLSFEHVGAVHYNVYVSTDPQSVPFDVTGGAGKMDCSVQWAPSLGGTALVIGYDVEAGITPGSNIHFILVSGDNGSSTEGSLGFSSSSERSADTYCDR